MKIGGFQKNSFIDFPGKISAVIFTQGCNFRCPFCHNSELIPFKTRRGVISLEEIYLFLKKRHGLLEGVTITGGEPTLQKNLPDVIRKIKGMGYSIKLDTNGTNPGMLKLLFEENLLDFVAMDLKSPFGKYLDLTGVSLDLNKIKRSIKLIEKFSPDYQFRTTMVQPLLELDDVPKIIDLIDKKDKYVVQIFTPSDKVMKPSLNRHEQYTEKELNFYLESLN